MLTNHSSFVRTALLTVIAGSLAMMSTKVWLYRPLLALPGGRSYVFGTAGLFVLYGFIVLWVTRTDDPVCRTGVKVGTPLGLIAGVIQIAHLTQEEFWDLGKVGNGISGFGLLLCTFLVWGMAGHRAAREPGAVRSGTMAGLWSAIVTMSLLILFGFFVEFYLATPKPEYVATWGEFKRSGWTDIHAFTMANTLDAAQSHLIIGPIIGGISGGIAGVITHLHGKREQSPTVL
jgi:hypothetical protein